MGIKAMKPAVAPEDSGEFLPDEFVLDELPEEPPPSSIVFAGPSDAPPALPPPAQVASVRPEKSGWAARYGFVAFAAALAAAGGALVGWPRDGGHAAREPEAVLPVVRHPAAETPIVEVAPPAPREEALPALPVREEARPAAPAREEAAPGEVAPADAASALEAKRASQGALEKGHTEEAITAGERAVALDPTDAEAWLILGAAYDQRGARADARRCFKSCVDLARRGPRGECSALLR
jgi:tetratricopeptide (TPR) repeat protein